MESPSSIESMESARASKEPLSNLTSAEPASRSPVTMPVTSAYMPEASS